jgi:hypothetical protein
MKIKWYGHAAFLITSDRGFKIITDPYEPGGFGGAISYGKIQDKADVVLVSHDHADHNYVEGLPGQPRVIKGTGLHRVADLEIRGIGSYHDERKGSERGQNTIFCFTIDGLKVCHLGDLGYVPTEQEAKQIGPVDLLFLPIGGVYTVHRRPFPGYPDRKEIESASNDSHALQDSPMRLPVGQRGGFHRGETWGEDAEGERSGDEKRDAFENPRDHRPETRSLKWSPIRLRSR